MCVTIRASGSARRDFSRWLNERLEQCDINPANVHDEIGLKYNNVYRYRTGKRNPAPLFLSRILLLIKQEGGFRHPGDVMYGLGLLNIVSQEVFQLIKATLEVSREREAFLTWLERWNQPYVDPRAQGVRLPSAYVEREVQYDLKGLLLDNKAARRMYIWGMGGIGKSSLVKAVLLDEEVQQSYTNGVLWAKLGPDASPKRELKKWCKLLGLPVSEGDLLWELAQRVEKCVKAPWRRFLIVIDDVWKAEDATPLLVDAPGSRVLITTREKHIAQKLGVDDHIIELAPMSSREAETLVKRRLGAEWSEQSSENAEAFIDFVDGLPLALSIGSSVVKQRGWGYLWTHLAVKPRVCSTLALIKPEGRQHSLRLTIDASYNCLFPDNKRLLTRLGMFNAGSEFTVADAYFYWFCRALIMKTEEKSLPIRARIADQLQELADLSMVLDVDSRKRYRLHSLVGHYVAEKLKLREDVDWLWYQFIVGALNNLTHGVVPSSLSPKGRRDLLREQWPHIARAWQHAQLEQYWQQATKLDQDPGQQAMRWAEGFGLLGCQALWRRRDWKGVAKWAKEARELYQRGYQRVYNGEPSGPICRSLLIWSIDALFRQRRCAPLPPLLDALQDATLDASPAWRLRYRIRRVRYQLLGEGDKAIRDAVLSISVDARSLVNRDRRMELAFHTLGEIHDLLGDYASWRGQAVEAEKQWRLVCQRIVEIVGSVGLDDFGFGAWRLEQEVEKIVHWRASHGLWREAVRLGTVWFDLRRWLGEDVEESLRWIALWALNGGDLQISTWVVDQLTQLAEEMEDVRSIVVCSGLEGLLAAHHRRWDEAEEKLREALVSCEVVQVCDESWRKILSEAVDRVQDQTQPSLSLPTRGTQYDIPYNMLTGQAFEVWLRGKINQIKRESGSKTYPLDAVMNFVD
jgi:hypothetical protein